MEENARRLEQNQRCLFLSNAAAQWLDIRLQLIGVSVVTGLGVIAVVQHQFDSVDPGESTAEIGGCDPVYKTVSFLTVCCPSGLVGLSLSYSLSITMLLSGLISNFTETEMQLVSVERTEEYSTNLPIEPQQLNAQVRPAAALKPTRQPLKSRCGGEREQRALVSNWSWSEDEISVHT